MGLPYETAAYTLIGMATRFQDFFYAPAQDVTFEYMNENGEVNTATVPNVAKIKSQLDAEAVTDAELADALKSYYDKVEVDAIRDAIMGNFDSYYNKDEVDAKITDVSKETVTSKESYFKNVLSNNNNFDSSGLISDGNAHYVNGSNAGLPIWTSIDYTTLKPSVMYIGNDTYEYNAAITSNNNRVVTFNVNGHILTLNNGSYNTASELADSGATYVKFPDAPTLSSTVIDDVNNAPAIEQGDFLYITDTTNTVLPFPQDLSIDPFIQGSFYIEPGAKVEYDSDNNELSYTVMDASALHAFYICKNLKLIKGLEYEITLEIERVNCADATVELFFYKGGDDAIITDLPDGVNTYTFVENGNFNYFITTSANGNNNEKINIKQLAIKVKKPKLISTIVPFAGGKVFEKPYAFCAAKTVARKDLVFLEQWEEDIAEKDIVYPYGNTQYVGGDIDGVTGIIEGTFVGADTYSLHGTWENPGNTVGKGYVWSNLNTDERIALATNGFNNIYKDGDKWLQTRYRLRVVRGGGNLPYNYFKNDIGNEISYVNNTASVKPKGKLVSIVSDLAGDYALKDYSIPGQENGWFYRVLENTEANNSLSNGCCVVKSDDESLYSENSETYCIPIAIVQRLNDGAYHPSYNPDGTSRFFYNDNAVKWHVLANGTITSLADCFNPDLIAAINKTDNTDVVKLSDVTDDTYISTSNFMTQMPARPDEIFANEINKRLIENIIINAKNPEEKRILDENFYKLVDNVFRGNESPTGFVEITRQNSDSRLFKISSLAKGSTFRLYTKTHASVGGMINPDDFTIGNKYYIMDEDGKFISFKVEYKEVHDGGIVTTILDSTMTIDEFTLSTAGKYYYYPKKKMFITANITDTNMNGTITYTDFVGDPRPLKYRIKYNTASNNSGTVNIDNYVLHSNGTYYISLSGRGDLSDIEKDIADNGSQWKNLGTDGTIGGLPKDALNVGVNANLNISYEEETVELFPTKHKILNYNSNGLSVNYIRIPLLRPTLIGREIVVINSKTGKKYQPEIYTGHGGQSAPAWDAVNVNVGTTAITNNTEFGRGVTDTVSIVTSYTDSDGNKTVVFNEDDIEFLTAYVSYDTAPNFLTTRWLGKSVLAGGLYLTAYRDSYLAFYLINRRLTGTYGDTSRRYIRNVQYWNFNTPTNGILSTSWLSSPELYYLHHADVHMDAFRMDNSKYGVKTIPFLSIINQRYVLGFLYKELKNNGTTWGDDSNFQISDYQNTVLNSFGAKVVIGVKYMELPYYRKGK